MGTGPEASPDAAPKRPGSRRKARRRAVELLFEAEARNLDPAQLAAERSAALVQDLSAPQLGQYALLILEGVRDNLQVLDETIAEHLRGWTLERLPAVDRAILRIAVWELLFAPDVPTAVAVDEALELAKELSTDESPAFLNGVLGKLVGFGNEVRAAASGQSAPELRHVFAEDDEVAQEEAESRAEDETVAAPSEVLAVAESEPEPEPEIEPEAVAEPVAVPPAPDEESDDDEAAAIAAYEERVRRRYERGAERA